MKWEAERGPEEEVNGDLRGPSHGGVGGVVRPTRGKQDAVWGGDVCCGQDTGMCWEASSKTGVTGGTNGRPPMPPGSPDVTLEADGNHRFRGHAAIRSAR